MQSSEATKGEIRDGLPPNHVEVFGGSIVFEIGEGVGFGFTITPGDGASEEDLAAAMGDAASLVPSVRAACQWTARCIMREGKFADVAELRLETFKLIRNTHLDCTMALAAAIIYARNPGLYDAAGYCLCGFGRAWFEANERATPRTPPTSLSLAMIDAVGDRSGECGAKEWILKAGAIAVESLARHETRRASVAATPPHATRADADETPHEEARSILEDAQREAATRQGSRTRDGGLLS